MRRDLRDQQEVECAYGRMRLQLREKVALGLLYVHHQDRASHQEDISTEEELDAVRKVSGL